MAICLFFQVVRTFPGHLEERSHLPRADSARGILLRLGSRNLGKEIASDMSFSFGFTNGPDGALNLDEGTTEFDETGNPMPAQV